MGGQADGLRDGRAGKHTDSYTDGRAGRRTERQTGGAGRRTHTQTGRQPDGRVGRQATVKHLEGDQEEGSHGVPETRAVPHGTEAAGVREVDGAVGCDVEVVHIVQGRVGRQVAGRADPRRQNLVPLVPAQFQPDQALRARDA